MNQSFNPTMLAIPYIRGYLLNEKRSQELISSYVDVAKDITEKINRANGGMFTRNVATRSFYFKKELEKHNSLYDQVLVLGIGLDTKFDELECLKKKKIFAIDIESDNIKNIYLNAKITSVVSIIKGDFTSITDGNILDELKMEGFNCDKKTFILWEGGTFYLSPDQVFFTLDYLKENVNVVGFTGDFLNGAVIDDKNHPCSEMIGEVLKILKNSGNEWRGFFYESYLNDYFIKTSNFNYSHITFHGDVEKLVYDYPLVIPDLIMFISSIKKDF